jgi:H2-forming N5,N10-methylenetetrahydromethanopterin dehydrogenase-like enzyme
MIVPNLAERRARLPARGGELLRRQQVCKYWLMGKKIMTPEEDLVTIDAIKVVVTMAALVSSPGVFPQQLSAPLRNSHLRI